MRTVYLVTLVLITIGISLIAIYPNAQLLGIVVSMTGLTYFVYFTQLDMGLDVLHPIAYITTSFFVSAGIVLSTITFELPVILMFLSYAGVITYPELDFFK